MLGGDQPLRFQAHPRWQIFFVVGVGLFGHGDDQERHASHDLFEPAVENQP